MQHRYLAGLLWYRIPREGNDVNTTQREDARIYRHYQHLQRTLKMPTHSCLGKNTLPQKQARKRQCLSPHRTDSRRHAQARRLPGPRRESRETGTGTRPRGSARRDTGGTPAPAPPRPSSPQKRNPERPPGPAQRRRLCRRGPRPGTHPSGAQSRAVRSRETDTKLPWGNRPRVRPRTSCPWPTREQRSR